MNEQQEWPDQSRAANAGDASNDPMTAEQQGSDESGEGLRS